MDLVCLSVRRAFGGLDAPPWFRVSVCICYGERNGLAGKWAGILAVHPHRRLRRRAIGAVHGHLTEAVRRFIRGPTGRRERRSRPLMPRSGGSERGTATSSLKDRVDAIVLSERRL